MDDDDDEGELQRFKSVTEKSWSKFGELGFKDVESSKLEFECVLQSPARSDQPLTNLFTSIV